MLRSKPQRRIPELSFGYPPLKKLFREKLGAFLDSLGWSERQLYKNLAVTPSFRISWARLDKVQLHPHQGVGLSLLSLLHSDIVHMNPTLCAREPRARRVAIYIRTALHRAPMALSTP